MNIELKGGAAILVVAAIIAVGAGKFVLERSTLEAGAAEEIKLQLRGEYLSRRIQDLSPSRLAENAGRGAGRGTGRGTGRGAAEELLSLSEIEFTSVSARGRGDDVLVRVEIQVAGKAPPDGKRVRYYHMSHSLVTGWRVERQTTALSYYLRLL